MSDLSPVDLWMVDRNVEYVATEGLEAVLARLRAQGYHRVADAVERRCSDESVVAVGRTVGRQSVQGG
jgi:hypothetical protein